MSIAEYAIYSVCAGLCLAHAADRYRGLGWRLYCYSSAVFILIRAIEVVVQP